MDREQLIKGLSAKARLVRAEYKYSQEDMARALGLSKKTLVQVEKERTQLSWTAVVALCAIFRESEILKMTLGDSPVEVVETLVLDRIYAPKTKTLGGKVWWRDVKKANGFKMQQNLISGHFRILGEDNHRWYSSFNKEYIEERFNELIKQFKEQ